MKYFLLTYLLLHSLVYAEGSIEDIDIDNYKTGDQKLSIKEKQSELSLEDLLSIKLSSGSFLDLNTDNSPYSITIITAEQIRLSGAQNISEVLEIYVPGFQYMYNKWGGILWGLRGVSNDRNTKLVYLINGHKVNTQGRDGFIAETTLGLLSDIEKVEVLRGASGLVYGSGSIAGVVNVITKTATNNKSNGSISYGTHNDAEVELNIYTPYNDVNKMAFSFGYATSDGSGEQETYLYGQHSWPYPAVSQVENIEDLETRGVPSDGSYGSTPGNLKAAFEYSRGNFTFYSRATRSIINAGAWFIYDPYPDVIGAPSTGEEMYIQRTIPNDNIYTYPKDSVNSWIVQKNGENNLDTLGITHDNIYFTPTEKELIGRENEVMVNGKNISPDNTFWNKTESYTENRRQYVNDNLLFDAEYTIPLNKDQLLLKAGIDIATNRIQTEENDRYGAIEGSGIKETFGERRYGLKAQYLLNTVDKLNLALGTEFRIDQFGKDIQGLNEKNGNSNIPIIKDTTYTNLAFFTEGNYKVTQKFDFQLGLRYDNHTHANMINGKIASIYKFNYKNNIKLVFQTASNNGSVDNYEYNRNHYDQHGNINTELTFERPYTIPNISTDVIPAVATVDELHSLEPENVKTIELTSHHKIGSYFDLNPSVTYGEVTNLFGWSQELYRVVNAGKYQYINVDFDAKLDHSFFNIGLMHTIQRPVNTDVEEQNEEFTIDAVDKSDPNWYTTQETDDGTFYTPNATSTETVNINVVKNSITNDGENFLNLATQTTKLFFDYTPVEWFSFHSDLRVFWGLKGREDIYKADQVAYNYQYWNVWDHSIKKLNSSIHFHVNETWDISLFAYNILGIDNGIDSWEQGDKIADISGSVINTIRWQQMAEPNQKGISSTDQRSFKIKVTKLFD